ncbi:MAG: hypothetical protein K2H43_06965 [Clostridia bacterium]|nr:hypothetical protein [Clostridia bacterium]
MEFFDWISVPQVVLAFLEMTAETAAEAVAKLRLVQIICLASAAGLYLVGLLFGGFGLMAMAKRKGMKNWWIGFLPFGNTWLAGKLAGATTAFGVKVKRPELWAVLTEILYVLLETAMLVLSFMLMNAEFYDFNVVNEEYGYWEFSSALFLAKSPEFGWVMTLNTVINVLASISRFVALFFFFIMFAALFRKYYARSPMIMTLLCALLPVRGFVLFAVRNNTPVDYNAYMRRRMEEFQRRQTQQYGGYANGNPGGGYNGGAAGGYSGGSAGDPFSEFGGSNAGDGSAAGGGTAGSGGDDPFSDFN